VQSLCDPSVFGERRTERGRSAVPGEHPQPRRRHGPGGSPENRPGAACPASAPRSGRGSPCSGRSHSASRSRRRGRRAIPPASTGCRRCRRTAGRTGTQHSEDPEHHLRVRRLVGCDEVRFRSGVRFSSTSRMCRLSRGVPDTTCAPMPVTWSLTALSQVRPRL
jgi:hypothetical protein